MRHNLNVDVNNNRIEGIFEKVGSLFGKRGKRIGRVLDRLTKNVTVKIDTRNDTDRRDDYS